MRTATVCRATAETNINLTLTLDGEGKSEISTGCGFLNHMLTLFAKHSGFNLTVSCNGDTDVDFHHTTEDIGISLGLAFKEALGDKKGIFRYADCILPMDEALIMATVDISGRGMLCFDCASPSEKVGCFDTELNEEFFSAFARNAGVTLHIRKLAGSNSHHIIEGCFKAAGRCLKNAVAIDADNSESIPSTKGVL